MTTMYSEFYKHGSHFETSLKGNDAQECHCCGLTSRYCFAEQAHGTCKFCQNFEAPSFLGKERLIADLALAPDEQVGITVSGGKDSIYMWAKLCEMLGADHVVAFHHHKVGLTHPYASENIEDRSFWDKALFNGEGPFLGNDLGNDVWYPASVRAKIRRNHRLLRQYADGFDASDCEPLVPLHDVVLAHRFGGGERQILTLFNPSGTVQRVNLPAAGGSITAEVPPQTTRVVLREHGTCILVG